MPAIRQSNCVIWGAGNPQFVFAIVDDPMLATGSSAVAAIKKVKGMRPKSVKFLCL